MVGEVGRATSKGNETKTTEAPREGCLSVGYVIGECYITVDCVLYECCGLCIRAM